MTQYDLYPMWAVLDYVVSTFTHRAVFPLKPDDPNPPIGIEPVLINRAGDPVAAVDALTELANAYKATFDVGDAEFAGFNIWAKGTVTADPYWVYAFAYGQPGDAAGSPQLAGQLVATFRTLGGHIMKTYMMETNNDMNVKSANVIGNTRIPDWTEYVLGETAIVVGRDGHFAATGINILTKYNDALRKRRFLGS